MSCRRCKKSRPPDGGSSIVDSETVGDLASKGDDAHHWREVLDENSKQMYYYHLKTMETTWDRPEVMGPAPYASGWYGRGEQGSKAGEEYTEKNERWLQRPARKQKDHIEANTTRLEGSENYNIWYGKFTGDNWRNGGGNPNTCGPAENRCVMESDAGQTKADLRGSSSRFFCIQFARGRCARGSDCTWFHRIPTAIDDGMLDEMHDCFGRERHATHLDNMSGAGSFMEPSRTLYVGRIRPDQYNSDDALHAELKAQFGEFGEVEHINVISSKNLAFVRYRFRSACEFGREAMNGQSLGKGEVLNVRWARDDPNPKAQEAIRRADADAAVAALARRGVKVGEGDGGLVKSAEEGTSTGEVEEKWTAPEGAEEELRRKRKRQKVDDPHREEEATLAYPNTDAQYNNVCE